MTARDAGISINKGAITVSTSVLVVDDSSFIVEGLVSILKKHSYRPLAAYSGEQCLKILKTEIPDIIILDILMEPMDGWETLARIRRDIRARHIPVLIFSAKKLSIEDAETYRISIDDFIAKPIVPATLLTAIDRVLHRHEADRRLAASWRSSGVEEDRIDTYLSVKNELTIDTQLHAVLQRQADLCSGDSESCRDIIKALHAIEERIEAARTQLDRISSGLPRADDGVTDPKQVHEADGRTGAAPRLEAQQAGPGVSDTPQDSLPPAQENEVARTPAVPVVDNAATGNPEAAEPAGMQPAANDREPAEYPGGGERDAPAGVPVDTGGLEPIYYNRNTELVVPVHPPIPERKEDLFEPDTPYRPQKTGYHDQERQNPEMPPAKDSLIDRVHSEARHDPSRGVADDSEARRAVLSPQEHGGFFSRLITSILSLLRGLKLKR